MGFAIYKVKIENLLGAPCQGQIFKSKVLESELEEEPFSKDFLSINTCKTSIRISPRLFRIPNI